MMMMMMDDGLSSMYTLFSLSESSSREEAIDERGGDWCVNLDLNWVWRTVGFCG